MAAKQRGEKKTARRRRSRRRNVRLQAAPAPKISRYLHGVLMETSFLKFLGLLIGLWLLSAAGIYRAERGVEGTSILSYGNALYWGIAAFSTAGIADAPHSSWGQLVGGLWIVAGSAIFFGTIIATVTSYFMRPMQRPVNQIVDTIEYNLENLEDLSVDELALLKETTDTLIDHMEKLKEREAPEDT